MNWLEVEHCFKMIDLIGMFVGCFLIGQGVLCLIMTFMFFFKKDNSK